MRGGAAPALLPLLLLLRGTSPAFTPPENNGSSCAASTPFQPLTNILGSGNLREFRGFGHSGGQIIRKRQMGDSLYYFQDRPDRWGVSPTLQLYFACILPRHSQTPRTINRILTQCLSSLRP